jgi:hypothetical protein
MKENTKLANGKTFGYEARIDVISFDALIGRLFTHVELLGLTDRQLSALKATVRGMCWEWYNGHLDNESGYADPSHAARVEAGIEPLSSGTNGIPVHMVTTLNN